MSEKQSAEPLAYGVKDAARILGISRTMLYGEIKAGRMRAVKVGRRTLIRHLDAEAWLAEKARGDFNDK